MRIEEFKEWLAEVYPETPATVSNRISNCKNVEKYHGDLDMHFKNDECNSIMELLKYTTNDERMNKAPNHQIPIEGNIRNGSVTYRSAVKLYIDFKNDEALNQLTNPFFEKNDILNTSEDSYLTSLIGAIDGFKYDKRAHNEVPILQEDICDHLNKKLTEFKWQTEYNPSSEFGDRIDIIGLSDNNNYKMIIELDGHRADQISKKFLSRMALFHNDNTVYISLCYPIDNHKNNEYKKYFKYCLTVTDTMLNNGKLNKMYAGILLN